MPIIADTTSAVAQAGAQAAAPAAPAAQAAAPAAPGAQAAQVATQSWLGGRLADFQHWVATNPAMFVILLILGLLLCLVLFLAGRFVWKKWRMRRVSKNLEEDLMLRRQLARMAEGGESGKGAERELLRSRLDEVDNKFRQGLFLFSSHGKRPDSLPWFLLLGEPGSGKTEMMRRGGLPFPPGIVDPTQGQTGTTSFDWWVTSEAVVLDVAGRLFLNRWGGSSDAEWSHFLKRLKKARGILPINGVALAVPADALLADDDALVQKKAKLVAEELRTLQSLLGLCLPVHVVVTKMDVVPGFREFFAHLPDGRRAQVLGWANSSPTGNFSMESTTADFNGLVAAIKSLRPTLFLSKRLWTLENEQGSRGDQAAAMNLFPGVLAQMAEPLKEYLASVFAASQWSGDSLLMFRGCYFTSASDKGVVLDPLAAAASGNPVEQTAAKRTPVAGESFFIKNLFLEKIFPEGLLAFHSPTAKLKLARPYVAGALAALAAAAALFLAARLERGNLASMVAAESPTWVKASELLISGEIAKSPVIISGDVGQATPAFLNSVEGYPEATRESFLRDMVVRSAVGIPLSLNFHLAAAATGRFERNLLGTERQQFYELLFAKMFFVPMVEAAREKMLAGKMDVWNADATQTLVTLIDIENAMVRRELGKRVDDMHPFDADPLASFVFPQSSIFNLSSPGVNPGWDFNPANPGSYVLPLLNPGSSAARVAIAAGVEEFCRKWLGGSANVDLSYYRLAKLSSLLRQFGSIEDESFALAAEFRKKRQAKISGKEAVAMRDRWLEMERKLAATTAAILEIDAAVPATKVEDVLKMASEATNEYAKVMDDDFKIVRSALEECARNDRVNFFRPLLGNLDDSLAAARRSLRAQVEEFGTRLSVSLGDLWESKDGLREYRRRAAIYAAVAEAAAEPEQPRSLGELKRKYDADAGTMASARRALGLGEEKPKASGDDTGAGAGAGAGAAPAQVAAAPAALGKCESAAAVILELTKRANDYEIMAAAVKVAPNTTDGFRDWVANNIDGGDTPVKPLALPFTKLTSGFRFDPGFNTVVAHSLAAKISWLDPLFNPGAKLGATNVDTGTGDLANEYAAILAGYKDYRTQYYNYWVANIDELLAVEPFNSWGEFVEATRKLKSYQVNDSLREVYVAAAAALETMPIVKGGQLELAVKGRVDWYNAQLKLLSPEFFQAAALTLASWSTLPKSAAEAFSTINAMSAEQVQTGLLAAYSAESASRVDWWAQYVGLAGTALRREISENIKEDIKSLSSKLMSFPICNTPDRSRILAPNEINDIFGRVATFFQHPGKTPAPAAPPDTGKPPAPAVGASVELLPNFQMLEALKADVVLDTPAKALWFRKVRDITSLLDNRGRRLVWSLVVPGAAGQERVPARYVGYNVTPGAQRYRFMEIYSGGQRVGARVATLASDGKPRPYPETASFADSEELMIAFFEHAEDRYPAARVRFGGRWAAMNMYLRDEVWFDDESKCHMVPLEIVDDKGYRAFYWIGMAFNREVPPPSYWPTVDDWIEFSPVGGPRLPAEDLKKLLAEELARPLGDDGLDAANARVEASIAAKSPFGIVPAFKLYVPSLRDQLRRPPGDWPGGDEQLSPAVPSNVPDTGIAIVPYFELGVDGEKIGRIKASRDDGGEIRETGLMLPLGKGSVEFRFHTFPDNGKPFKTLAFDGPYVALNLLRSKYMIVNQSDRSFLVPLYLGTVGGQALYFWIGLDMVYPFTASPPSPPPSMDTTPPAAAAAAPGAAPGTAAGGK